MSKPVFAINAVATTNRRNAGNDFDWNYDRALWQDGSTDPGRETVCVGWAFETPFYLWAVPMFVHHIVRLYDRRCFPQFDPHEEIFRRHCGLITHWQKGLDSNPTYLFVVFPLKQEFIFNPVTMTPKFPKNQNCIVELIYANLWFAIGQKSWMVNLIANHLISLYRIYRCNSHQSAPQSGGSGFNARDDSWKFGTLV